MIKALLNTTVTVKRRLATSLAPIDSLGNPIYSAPTSSWATAYSAMPCRLAFSKKTLVFAATGERVTPSGTMYFGPGFTILSEDRIITTDGIEYVVLGSVRGFVIGAVLDHWECQLALP